MKSPGLRAASGAVFATVNSKNPMNPRVYCARLGPKDPLRPPNTVDRLGSGLGSFISTHAPPPLACLLSTARAEVGTVVGGGAKGMLRVGERLGCR